MSKRPSFQFYPNDWLSSSSVTLMTPEQEGGYIRLLCHMWNNNCELKDDDKILSVLSRLNEGWFKGGSSVVRGCFILHPTKVGYLSHERLLKEKKKQDDWRKKSAKGGIKSGKKRKRKKEKGGSRVVEPNGNTSSSTSVIKDIVEYLNFKTLKSYKTTTKKTIDLIRARLNEKFTFDDFKQVIDTKTSQWINDPQNNRYLRPETLFGSKFESYLQENSAKKVVKIGGFTPDV